ncbi:histidyl-tRNA ligase [Candidatus Mycoplasma haematolamae str. Purdue]|uniref:Histidine--tRNA ligase n=1 Tax=Mycoplasma haematolamae (strain Purdue) TaxID=1212765 RepID=I7C5B5_MYCHA|nr:histidine--tRNA ligase [Candidatus Mycoplasma haematolamae]AFO51702.1 histidyl-tRNA ligase [Candidatus Mycoplasma haematolamae str. Purdue]
MFAQPRGTRTVLGLELEKKNCLRRLLTELVKKSCFIEIETPMFEYKTLFTNDKDDPSNILDKELFYLEGKKYALRPEGTAPVARAVVTEKLLHTLPSPLKFFYFAQCFRYERPQKGRFREFTQFGLEIINASSFIYEVETVKMIDSFLRNDLKLEKVELRINYLSSSETKAKWSKALTKYFLPLAEELSKTSQERIKVNPIRILDDRRDSQLKIVKAAPKISDFLSKAEEEEIKEIRGLLNKLEIRYLWDPNLVRGLDYYTGLVFEWSLNNLAIAGGGRYDELFNRFCKRHQKEVDKVPSLGLAIGIDRLQEALNEAKFRWPILPEKKIYLCNLTNEVDPKIMKLIERLREYEIVVDSNWDLQDLKSHFKYSSRLGIDWLLIYGPQERESREIILKQQFKNYKITFSLENQEALIREIRDVLGREIP